MADLAIIDLSRSDNVLCATPRASVNSLCVIEWPEDITPTTFASASVKSAKCATLWPVRIPLASIKSLSSATSHPSASRWCCLHLKITSASTRSQNCSCPLKSATFSHSDFVDCGTNTLKGPLSKISAMISLATSIPSSTASLSSLRALLSAISRLTLFLWAVLESVLIGYCLSNACSFATDSTDVSHHTILGGTISSIPFRSFPPLTEK